MGDHLFSKIWRQHEVKSIGEGWSLLHIDRHVLHDLSGPAALKRLKDRGLPVAHPELAFATPDHAVSTRPGRRDAIFPAGERLRLSLEDLTREAGIRLFDLGDAGQGIVHVVAHELGLTLPGVTLVCGDSHTCTNGGVGALGFGVGVSESVQALATQVLRVRRPDAMRITVDGVLGANVSAKDIALFLLSRLSASIGLGKAVEFAGSAVRALSVEERLTLCNMSVELGARFGLVAADDVVFQDLADRPYAPKGALFDRAVSYWRTLATDPDAKFDYEASLDAADIAPMITWGTSPDHAIPVDGVVPEIAAIHDPAQRETFSKALEYMGVESGQPIAGTPVDWVFIGSCTNGRLSDLRAAAQVVRGRKVADAVTAWVVPGSVLVKRRAEAEGLDRIFLDAGFQWREPGCSMCVAANGELVPPLARCVSTSNRNFVGRQGPGARTHLASPATAAAAAVTGRITDVRTL